MTSHAKHARHAKRSNSAAYVGRVGALAVALGIGAAVATTPGVAWADTPTGTSEDGADASPDTNETPLHRLAHALQSGLRAVSGIDDRRTTDPAPEATIGAVSPTADPDPDHSAPQSLGLPTTLLVPRHPAMHGFSPLTRFRPDTPRPSTRFPGPTDSVPGVLGPRRSLSTESPVIQSAAPTAAVTTTPPSTATLITHPVTVSPVSLPRPRPATALAALPGAFLSVAAGLLGGALPGVFGGDTPTTPVDPPMLWAVLAFVRRQFVNTTPTLNPTPTGTDPTTGLVYQWRGAQSRDAPSIRRNAAL